MAIRTKEELKAIISEMTDGRTDDRTLEIIEDLTDSIEGYETRLGDNTDWQQRYNDLDAEWRERYRSRFFSGGSGADEKVDSVEVTEEEKGEEPVKTKFEDLFE